MIECVTVMLVLKYEWRTGGKKGVAPVVTDGLANATQFVRFALLLVLSGMGQSYGAIATQFCLILLNWIHLAQKSNLISWHMYT